MTTRTPVALIMFRRPDLTRKVFDVIAEVKPPKLFLIADGPAAHRAGEAEKCAATRAVVEQVKWDCEVVRDYAETNMGPWRRIASGITSAFRQVEELIVLEDDCIPDPTFFRFCDELLERYRDDERIMHIAGNHLHPQDPRPTPYSYSYAWHNLAWGYATWRRAWQHFDLGVPAWSQLRDSGFLEQMVSVPEAVTTYRKIFDQLHQNPGEFDGYDWAWSFACWSQHGLSILPKTTLVRHVGFGPDSTHFPKAPNDPRATVQARPMSFPLQHPPCIVRDHAADDYILKTYAARKRASFPKQVYRKVRSSLVAALPTSVHHAASRLLSSVRATLAHPGTGESP